MRSRRHERHVFRETAIPLFSSQFYAWLLVATATASLVVGAVAWVLDPSRLVFVCVTTVDVVVMSGIVHKLQTKFAGLYPGLVSIAPRHRVGWRVAFRLFTTFVIIGYLWLALTPRPTFDLTPDAGDTALAIAVIVLFIYANWIMLVYAVYGHAALVDPRYTIRRRLGIVFKRHFRKLRR